MHDPDNTCGPCRKMYLAKEYWLECKVCEQWFHELCFMIISFHFIDFRIRIVFSKYDHISKNVFNIPIVIRIVDIFVETSPFISVPCYENETLNKCLFQEFLIILKKFMLCVSSKKNENTICYTYLNISDFVKGGRSKYMCFFLLIWILSSIHMIDSIMWSNESFDINRCFLCLFITSIRHGK